jgi:hypothetical protein
VTEPSPRVVIKFPKQYRKADCQGELLTFPGMSPETAKKLELARVMGRARRTAQDKILDGYMELISATTPAEADRWLQELLDKSRGEAS